MRSLLRGLVLTTALLGAACEWPWRYQPPLVSREVIVMNDENMFDNNAATFASNVQFYKNLVNFQTTGARAQAKTVLFHMGHGSACSTMALCLANTSPAPPPTLGTVVSGEGYTVVEGNDVTAPLTAIAADVKMIMLWQPFTTFSASEIGPLRKFLADSGRILYVVDYGSGMQVAQGVLNDFLKRLGSGMVNIGGMIDCQSPGGTGPAYYRTIPAASIRAHQVTTGLSELHYACASEVKLTKGDMPMFYDIAGTKVVGASARVLVRR